jgi:hypothetical protein
MLLQFAVKDIGQLTDFEPWLPTCPSLMLASGAGSAAASGVAGGVAMTGSPPADEPAAALCPRMTLLAAHGSRRLRAWKQPEGRWGRDPFISLDVAPTAAGKKPGRC